MKDKNGTSLTSEIANFIKNLSERFFKIFDKLIDIGFEITEDESKRGEDGSTVWNIKTGGGNKFKVKVVPVSKDGKKVNMYFETASGRKYEKKNVYMHGDDIFETMSEVCDDLFEESLEEYTKASSKIEVTLQKVTSGSETTINLVAINASCNATAALTMLNDIVSDDDFISQLTEEPSSFSIVDDGNEYDVERIDCVDTPNCLTNLMCKAMSLLQVVQLLHWNAKGEGFFQLHDMTDSILWNIRYQIDTLAEWCVQQNGYVTHPEVSLKNLDCCNGFTLRDGLAILKDQIDTYVSELDMCYCNLSADKQGVVDSWMLDLKQRSEYKLSQALKD